MGKSNRLSVLKKPKVLLPLLTGFLVIALVALAFHNLNSPAIGTVTTPNPGAAAASTQPPAGKDYADKNISFKYPGIFEISPNQKQPGYLEDIKLIKSGNRDTYASIAMFKGSLAADSGINLRKLRPQEYKIVSSVPDKIVFAKNDGKEYTGFIAHGGYELTISFTSVSPSDLAPYYNVVADSLIWKL